MRSHDPLEGAVRKLRRAQKHVDALKCEIGRHDKAVTLAARIEHRNDRTQAVLRVASVAATNGDWSVIIGDAIHNFRSALDHLAYAIVAHDRGRPYGDATFPIICLPEGALDTLDWLDRNRSREFPANGKWLKTYTFMSSDHRAILKRHQPYIGGEWRKHHQPLALLNRLSNQDKHRTLVTTMFGSGPAINAAAECIQDCRLEGPAAIIGTALEVDAELAEYGIEVTGPHPIVEVQHDIAPYVGIKEHFLWGIEPSNGIEAILDAIGAKVLEVIEDFAKTL